MVQPLRKGPSGPIADDIASGGPEGYDTVIETFTQNAVATIAEAAQLPSLPRDSLGNPLHIEMGAWTSGDYLEVTWAASGSALLRTGGLGILVPKVSIGGGAYQFVNNGAQFGVLGVPGSFVYTTGLCVVQLNTDEEVDVELGIFLKEGQAGDQLVVYGGPLSIITPVFSSTWMKARRVPASQIVQAPATILSDLPIPSP